jgi:hypothetical protein
VSSTLLLLLSWVVILLAVVATTALLVMTAWETESGRRGEVDLWTHALGEREGVRAGWTGESADRGQRRRWRVRCFLYAM